MSATVTTRPRLRRPAAPIDDAAPSRPAGPAPRAEAPGAPGAPAPPLARNAQRPGRVLAVASLGAALAFVDATIVNVAFPDIRADFRGTPISALSWIFNAYNIVFAALLVCAGRFADLLGRRRIFHAGIILFTVASVLCAFAPSAGALIAARALQAVGAAILVPASLALVLQAFPSGERAHAVALWSAAAALAGGLGPSLGGLLVEAGGWRLAFLINVPLGVAALVAGRRMLVESRAPGRRTLPDLRGAGLAAVAIGSLTLAIVQGEEWGWTSPAVLGAAVVALAVGVVFVRRCSWHPSPMLDLDLLRIRSLSVANVLSIVGAAGFYAYLLNNVLFLTSVWRYSVLEAGLALTPGPLVAAAVARAASRLAERLGHRPVLFAGALAWSAGLFYLVAAVDVAPAFVAQWLPGMLLLGVGAGITFPLLGSAGVTSAPGERFATATALNSVSRQLGAVLGVALVVVVVGTPAPAAAAAAFDRGWTFSAACLLIVAFGALALGRLRTEADAPAVASTPPADTLEPASQREPRVAGAAPAVTRAGHDDAPLRAAPVFGDLDDRQWAALLAGGETVRVRAGEWLVRAGELAEALYILRSGRLECVAATGEITILDRGSVIGDLSLVTNLPHEVSVRARRDSELLAVAAPAVRQLLRDRPEIATSLLRTYGARLREDAPPPACAPPARTLAVVPLQTGLPMAELCEALQRELARGGPLARLDGAAALGEAGRVRALERRHEQVLLIAGAPGTGDEWTEFCLTHADRILAVTAGGPVPLALQLQPALRGCELLFLEGSVGTRGLGLWLDVLEPRGHHVIRRGESMRTGTASVARRLSGRSVGLVLSGGAARGFAHIGVLEELRTAGVTIDRIGGTSMGAFIGALAAMGMEPDEIDARCYEEWVKRNPLSDYRIPRVSLIRGNRAEAMLERTLPGSIEQLPLDFFSVSCDLTSGEAVVHRRGPLVDAVGASISLPGLVPPLAREGRLLVDGGVLNNLPVDVMAAAGEGPIIASDVTNRRGAVAGDSLTIGETLMRTLTLGSVDTAAAAQRYADLVITPEDQGVGFLEFHQIDRLREAGRRAAHDALATAPAHIFG